MEWISVNDMLPKNGQIVIAYMPPYGEMAYQCEKTRMCTYWGSEIQNGFTVAQYGRSSEDVTHWMPLPDPPEDE